MNMIRVSVLDDEQTSRDLIKEYILRFQDETKIDFDIHFFSDPLSFLDEYVVSDLVLMDIDMPHLNGIETAEKLRKKDENCFLIFITNYVQYAIKGYSVNATDYVLKPLQYARFSALLSKVAKRIIKNQNDSVTIKSDKGLVKLLASQILYVEIHDHLLVYVTENGEYTTWGSLKDADDKLPKEYFERCNHSTIVNLKKVIGLNKNEITMSDGKILVVSQKKKAGFLDKLNYFLK